MAATADFAVDHDEAEEEGSDRLPFAHMLSQEYR